MQILLEIFTQEELDSVFPVSESYPACLLLLTGILKKIFLGGGHLCGSVG